MGSADVVADRIANIEKQKDGNFTTEVGRKTLEDDTMRSPGGFKKSTLGIVKFEGEPKKWWTEGMMMDDV